MCGLGVMCPFGLYGEFRVFKETIAIMENQMENAMEDRMDTLIIEGFVQVSGLGREKRALQRGSIRKSIVLH